VVVSGTGGGGGGAVTGDDGAAVVAVGAAVGDADRSAATWEELAAGAGRATPAGLAEHAAPRPHATASTATNTERFDVAAVTASAPRGTRRCN